MDEKTVAVLPSMKELLRERLSLERKMTRFGEVFLLWHNEQICGLYFSMDELIADFSHLPSKERSTSFCIEEIMGTSVPLLLIGSRFQIDVWNALLQIPIGEVRSYQIIAKAIGKPKAVRAVGSAVGKNRISLLVPCHRIIRSDGSIGHYRFGSTLKKQILQWESAL